jgi:hypothetical protein
MENTTYSSGNAHVMPKHNRLIKKGFNLLNKIKCHHIATTYRYN